jgi:hypothetical protein
VNLEILKDTSVAQSGITSRFVGFALEPEPLGRSLPELAARGASVGKPVPFRSRRPDGTRATLWTTVSLPSVSSEAVNVFLCEYGHDVPARRRELSEQLRSREGGPLSILSIREVVYGTTNAARLQERWQKLSHPVSATSAGVWPMGAGPALRVVAADQDGIRGVVIVVKSLEQARRFLKARGARLGRGRFGDDFGRGVSGTEHHARGVNATETLDSDLSRRRNGRTYLGSADRHDLSKFNPARCVNRDSVLRPSHNLGNFKAVT